MAEKKDTVETKSEKSAGEPLGKNETRTYPKLPCPICGQLLSTCLDLHVRADISPQTPDFQKRWDGVRYNGVKYKGPCVVPVRCLNEIKGHVARWEEGERQLGRGATTIFNAGTISGKGS